MTRNLALDFRRAASIPPSTSLQGGEDGIEDTAGNIVLDPVGWFSDRRGRWDVLASPIESADRDAICTFRRPLGQIDKNITF